MKTIVLLIASTVFSLSLHAADKIFLGNLALEPTVLSFTDATNWDSGSLPEAGDHVRISGGRFVFEPPGGSKRIEFSSLEAAELGGFIKGGEFVASEDMQARVFFVGAQTQLFEWGGTLTLSTPNHWDVALTIAGGLSSKDQSPRVKGKNLVFAKAGGFLGFAFYRAIPRGLPGNTEPLLLLTGDLDFADPTRVVIEGLEVESDLPPGEYLLAKAARINGSPELEFKGWSNPPSGAKLRVENGQLILEIP